jgi:phage anti-repressor protein
MTKVIENITQPIDGPRIVEYKGKAVVSARDLYATLGLNPSQFTRWCKKNITGNEFAIHEHDWLSLDIMSNGKTDFALTVDFAKRLAMMARTEKGEQIRNYFLQCEAKALSKPRSQIELLLESVQILHNQEGRLKSIESKVESLEAKSTTSLGHYSIAGFAALKKRSIDIKTAAALGAKGRAACRAIGAITGTIPDPRFGRVNTYPEDILENVFQSYFSNL